MRVALMGGLSLCAVKLGRRQSGLNTLAFVAARITLITSLILGNACFQLSFASTLGWVVSAKHFTQTSQ